MSILESPTAQRNGQVMLCPTCQLSLKVGLEGNGEVDFCEKCQGMWVDNMEERHVLDLKPQVFTADELKRLHKYYHPLGKIDPVRYIPCPVCRQLMYRKNWGGHSGVMVSKCEQHGTWFATKEQIEKIQEYIASGGIEYEKLKLTLDGLENVNHKLTMETLERQKHDNYNYNRVRLYNFIGF